MALDPNINTLEKEKFRETVTGTVVAVTSADSNSPVNLLVNVTRNIVSIDSTTAVEITASANQIKLMMEPSLANTGRWYYGWSQAQAEAKLTWFTKSTKWSEYIYHSVWVVRGSGSAADLIVDRGFKA